MTRRLVRSVEAGQCLYGFIRECAGWRIEAAMGIPVVEVFIGGTLWNYRSKPEMLSCGMVGR